MYRTLLPLLLALLFAAPAAGQQNTVNAVIDATEMLVGEQVVLHTIVNCNAGSRVRFQEKKCYEPHSGSRNRRDFSPRHRVAQ